jgi:hypothetical protein
MVCWLLAKDDDAGFLVVLWPTNNDWPTHVVPSGDSPEGDGVERAVSAALDEYVARHADNPSMMFVDPLYKLALDRLELYRKNRGAVDVDALAEAVAERVVASLAQGAPSSTVPVGTLAKPARISPKAERNPNLVTTEEFADHLDCSEASVFELLKLGLPSIKSLGIGRRILKDQALAWLVGGGASRSRIAKKLAKAVRTKRSAAGSDHG